MSSVKSMMLTRSENLKFCAKQNKEIISLLSLLTSAQKEYQFRMEVSIRELHVDIGEKAAYKSRRIC
jgi:hypothetical protein